MALPTASTVTVLADIAQSLWSVQLLKDAAFNGGSMSMNNGRDLVLYVENYALENGITNNREGIRGVSNNVYRLVGSKLGEAQELYATGSGGYVPSPSGQGYTVDVFINHTVTADEAGEMFIQNDDWIGIQGLTTLSIVQSVFQEEVSFLFNSASGTINFDLSATTGNQWTLETGQRITANGLYKIVTP